MRLRRADKAFFDRLKGHDPTRDCVLFRSLPLRGAVGTVLGDVLQPAVQDGAELGERVGADVFVFAEAVELTTTDLVFAD